MALTNFMIPGSYCFVSAARIDKARKHVEFTIEVYLDNTKTSLLFTRDFSLTCLVNYKTVTSAFKLEPDGNEANGDYFWVPANATGDWAVHAGKYLQYMTQGESLTMLPHEAVEGEFFQDNTGKIFRIGSNSTIVQQVAGTMAVWNTFFAFEVSTAANTNLIKQCYEFLKTTPIAVGATDV
jgi:hypothetical protein